MVARLPALPRQIANIWHYTRQAAGRPVHGHLREREQALWDLASSGLTIFLELGSNVDVHGSGCSTKSLAILF